MARFTLGATRASAFAAFAVAAVGRRDVVARAQEAERAVPRSPVRSERPAAVAPVGQDRAAQASPGDLVVRLDRLENQIRQLTGAIEQLQFRNQQLEGQLRRMQEDTEYRFQSWARRARRARAPAASAAGSAGSTAADRRRRRASAATCSIPTQNPNAPGAPRTLGTASSAVGSTGRAAIGARRPWPARRSICNVGANPRRSASRRAVARSVARRRAVDAEGRIRPRLRLHAAQGLCARRGGFRAFLRKHPERPAVAGGAYWLGESLFQRQRYRDAAEAFLNVSTKYETSAKAPDALLRLGQSLAALGEKEAACASLGEVLRKYPRASASVKQGVEREQKRVRC